MNTRLNILNIVILSILMAAIILIVYTHDRQREFEEHNQIIQHAIVHGAATAVSLQLSTQRNSVRLFADEYRKLIAKLAVKPGDDKTRSILRTRLKQRFPGFVTFTMTNNRGVPILEDIDSYVGDVCQQDLSRFSKELIRTGKDTNNLIFIHPQPGNYHYDIMAPARDSGSVFFVSFDTKAIQNILKSHGVPGHTLMILKNSDRSLIEIMDDGTRDSLKRKIHLSSDEINRLRTSEEIELTDWVITDLSDKSFTADYETRLWKEAGFIALIVTVSSLFMYMIISYGLSRNESRSQSV